MPRMPRLLAAAVAGLLFALPARAQDPAPEDPLDQDGARVQAIEVVGAEDREKEILEGIPLRVGGVFERRLLESSVSWLWKFKRILVVEVRGRQGDTVNDVVLTFEVEVMPSWRRAVFTGYEAFERADLELWAGLVGQPVDRGAVSTIIERVEERYREEGYAKVRVEADYRDGEDEVRFLVDEGPKVTIGDLAFEGNEAIRGGNWWTPGLDIREALNNKPGPLFLLDSPYSESRLVEDENAILQLYADYGYLEARVRHRVEYTDDDEVLVTYEIEEGPLYRVRSVEVASAGESPLRFPADELMDVLGLEAGQPFEQARVRADLLALQRFYGERGHPTAARVRADPSRRDQFFAIRAPFTRGQGPVVVYDRDQALVDVRFEIQEGLPKRIRDVVIRGNRRTEDRVVRREISSEPGDLAAQEDAVRSFRRLTGLGYFKDRNRIPYVNWYWLDVGEEDLVDQVWELKDEASNNRLRFGGSYSSDNGPALLIELQKQNFDLNDLPSSWGSTLGEIWNGEAFTGAGQSLSLSLQPGTRYSTYSVSFSEPDLLREHINRLALSTYARRSVRLLSTYIEERESLGFRLARRFGRYFTLYGGPDWGLVDVKEIDANAPQDLIDQGGRNRPRTFALGARWNTVEDPFAPVDGGDFGLQVARTGGFMGGDWDYVKGEFSGESFLPLWEDSRGRHWVFALRGRARQAWVSGGLDALPYTERFYLGGHTSVRGFQFRGIGEDSNGFPEGGDVAWDASIEMRFPLLSTRQRGLIDEFEMIRGGLFLDMGSYGDAWDTLTPTRAAVGFGIRMRFPAMPTAPLSLDFGWPIRSLEGDDERVFSFTLGNF